MGGPRIGHQEKCLQCGGVPCNPQTAGRQHLQVRQGGGHQFQEGGQGILGSCLREGAYRLGHAGLSMRKWCRRSEGVYPPVYSEYTEGSWSSRMLMCACVYGESLLTSGERVSRRH